MIALLPERERWDEDGRQEHGERAALRNTNSDTSDESCANSQFTINDTNDLSSLSPAAVKLHGEEELSEMVNAEHAAALSGSSPPSSSPSDSVEGKGSRDDEVAAASATDEVSAGLESILLLGFFSDLDEEAEEVDDFVQAAQQLRKRRTDVPVRAAYPSDAH